MGTIRRQESTNGLLMQTAEALEDLGHDRSPCGDVAGLRLRVERDVVFEDLAAESAKRRETRIRSEVAMP